MAICPICRSDAEEIQVGFFYGKTFRYPKHGEFDVASTVLSTAALMNAPGHEWEAALKEAVEKAIEGSRPRILLYDFHDQKPSHP